MKQLTKLAAAVALASGAMTAPAMAEVSMSANAGFVSDYYFRGVNLGDAGLYAGFDIEAAGFYAGTWVIDDASGGNDGMETDFYVGYGYEFENGIALGIAYNRYEYTYTSDYEEEVVLSFGLGGFGFEYFDGTDDDGSTDSDYDGYTFSFSGEVFGVTYGHAENDDADAEYDWVELSASGEVAGLDATATLGKTTRVDGDALGFGDTDSGDGYLILDISKSFDL